MRVFADLQLHSPYSRATSKNMNLKELARFASMKGLNVVGTGDCTHPNWRKENRIDLQDSTGSGLYQLRDSTSQVQFIVTGEVNTTFQFGEKSRRIHHCLLVPSIESADAVSDRLAKYGNLLSDGRPTLRVTAPELVDEVLEADRQCVIFPAHAWTPWFSLFGANSGFDSVVDCYQDRSDKIFALETGMSSDPPMNWRLSQLDRLCLVSNSDAHSAWPWRLGREANVFDLEHVSYHNLVGAIRGKDPTRFLFTIETSPAYGKYHWTGHRECQVSMSARDARGFDDKCPKCGKKMTRGVEERVEQLADRPEGYAPKNAIGYRHLLPLSEIIALVTGDTNLASPKVSDKYYVLVGQFGSEYSVMLDAPEDRLLAVAGPEISSAILRVRNDDIFVAPGYDGVYGKLDLSRHPLVKKSVGLGLEQFV
ncbi:MAG TPA: endonuclease Q family protein [Candidatus Bathyarchaeia archaeon]|nr:endonuclease Q family protein [Candidatus Bathyarchaeia archaeon]